ncbi:MAG: hypothetical protein ABS35_14565 [Kaistia sp. SCN 65-12]|nr:MAG: hypothetical protein ABS35_14565 [Kaistia sp. SCN 65-12]
MVSGTIRYTEHDYALSQAKLSHGRTIPLWQGACLTACLGAAIGYGVATLLSGLLAQALPMLPQREAWGALGGAVLLVTAGAWRISTKLSPMQQAALRTQQAFLLDENGLQLSTDTAETCMKWGHFLVAQIEPDLIVLRTREETIVLLRPTFVTDRAAWDETKRIVGVYVAASSSMQPL